MSDDGGLESGEHWEPDSERESDSDEYDSAGDAEDGSQVSRYDTEDEDGVCERGVEGEGEDEEEHDEVDVEEENYNESDEEAEGDLTRVVAKGWEMASTPDAIVQAEHRIVHMIESRATGAIREDGSLTAAEAHRVLLTGLGAKRFIGAYVVIPHRNLEAQHVVAEVVPAFEGVGDKAEVGFRSPFAIDLLRRIVAVKEAMGGALPPNPRACGGLRRPSVNVDALAAALEKL
jgi:hypothetical protein